MSGNEWVGTKSLVRISKCKRYSIITATSICTRVIVLWEFMVTTSKGTFSLECTETGFCYLILSFLSTILPDRFPPCIQLSFVSSLCKLQMRYATDVDARGWFTCTSRCSNHTVTFPVLTVTWTVDGFWRSLDSHFMHSEKTAESRLVTLNFRLHYHICTASLCRPPFSRR